MSADNFERRYKVKKVGNNLYSDGTNYFSPWGKTGELKQVRAPNQARAVNPIDRRSAGKVILTYSVGFLAAATGLYALSQENKSDQEDNLNKESLQDSDLINTQGYKEVWKSNGVEIFKKGFTIAATIDLSKGSRLDPVFASSNENSQNPTSPWFDTWTLDQFRNTTQQSSMIITGSYFGIEAGKNSIIKNKRILVTQINYPQKLKGKIITRGWANPNSNYENNWRALSTNGDRYQILQIRSKSDIDSILNQYSTVITGLSVDAGKDRNNDVVRTMVGLKDGGRKIAALVGYGKQEQVIEDMEGLGFKRDAIMMLDGASSSTIGYTNEKGRFIKYVDSDKRDAPMILAVIP